MTLIKLNNNIKNQYEIILSGANYYLDYDFKVIESKHDEIIAIIKWSFSKIMIRWKL